MNETQRESTERAKILLQKSHKLGGEQNIGSSYYGVVDILTDLRHYCQAEEIPWDDVLKEAWEHWRKESINE
jgi:hypothetical protein